MGVGNLNGGLAMVINTQLSAVCVASFSLSYLHIKVVQSLHRLPVTIAVVGAAGSGKSTIIRKGCKPYGMSEPTAEILAAENSFKCTFLRNFNMSN
jgi:ABC-type antimicrobial peptide transport system ATPase subunit